MSADTKTGILSDVISLPKGGGAVQSIGESFQANLFSGTANFSIPIAVSPGRNNFGPGLNLNYSSGNGNSVFGLGWDLIMPSISRKTNKGLPQYQDEDTFLLSGHEDLVPIIDQQTGNALVRNNGSYEIKSYRPRIESEFSKIEQWTNRSDSSRTDVHWRITNRNNQTSIFGLSKQARIYDLKNESHIYQWLLQESFDAKGNHILYEYVRENPSLAINEIYEQNREYNNLYLRRIYYGNTPDNFADTNKIGPIRSGVDHDKPLQLKDRHYLFEVLFNYGDRTGEVAQWYKSAPNDISTQELTDTDWPLRSDSYSNYRPGFELRTLRLCHSVLMYHHFKEAGVGAKCLTKETKFEYQQDSRTLLSKLIRVSTVSHKKNLAGNYLQPKAFPPIEFQYSQFEPEKQSYQSLSVQADHLPPRSLNDARFKTADLFADGLPDLVRIDDNGIVVWRNKGNAKFDQPHPQHFVPSGFNSHVNGGLLTDTGGDGQLDLVVDDPPVSGFYGSTAQGEWKNFQRYQTQPNLQFDKANMQMLDLTGDGLADILVTRDHHFLWFQSQGEQGFSEPKFVERRHSLEDFPDVYFSDQTGRVRVADLTGDGLNDIVLLHNNRIDYWPNLGYGKFGKRITMANSPKLAFDFDPKRLFLVDIDGTGPTDLVYVDLDTIHFWFNQNGNQWSERQTIGGTPKIHDLSSLQFADIYGTGTAAIIWSYDQSQYTQSNYKVLDFCGGKKPHLLNSMSNNLGRTTKVEYAPSTKFYLEDLDRGTPWITALPFPVQVVEKTEVFDHINKTKLVSKYSYHHGYYDGREREFRGFGRVDQLDSEELLDLTTNHLNQQASQASNYSQAYFQTPVLTKNWFHTGIYFDKNNLSATGQFFDHHDLLAAYSDEYYQKDAQAFGIATNTVDDSETPIDAYRALKGKLLRSEVYGLDNTDKSKHPYMVNSYRYQVKTIQQKHSNEHKVHLTSQFENILYHYERNSGDPRVSQTLRTNIDDFGNFSDTISIAYPRRVPEFDEQKKLYISFDHRVFLNKDKTDSHYYSGFAIEKQIFEIVGYDFDWTNVDANNRPIALSLRDFSNLIPASANQTITSYQSFHDRSESSKARRLLNWERSYFRADSDAQSLNPSRLNLGEIDRQALPADTVSAIFSQTHFEQVYTGLLNSNDFQPGGLLENKAAYVKETDQADLWWQKSVTQSYEPGIFFQTTKTRDNYGNEANIEFDNYGLMLVKASDALSNTVKADNDYRLLQVYKQIDENNNTTELAFDTLGLIVGTVVYSDSGEGDSFKHFNAELTANQLNEVLTNPLQSNISNSINPQHDPHNLLGSATSRVVYDLYAFMQDRGPVTVYSLNREQHYHQLEQGNIVERPVSAIQHSISYLDGSGREQQNKVLAESEANYNSRGELVTRAAEKRWLVSAAFILNNKGSVVKKFEPYFSSHHRFDEHQRGVADTYMYDTLERNIGILHPNHSYQKVVFDAWQQQTWDVNDTIDPNRRTVDLGVLSPTNINFTADQDPDIGYLIQRLGDAEYKPSWYQQRKISAEAQQRWPDLQSRQAESSAAEKAAEHASTPTRIYLDSLGRRFLTIVDNGINASGNREEFSTRIQLDISGKELAITDPRGIVAFRHEFDMAGNNLTVDSVDAGKKVFLQTTDQLPLINWDANWLSDSKGHKIEFDYDALRRPIQSWITPKQAPSAINRYLAESIIYGESINGFDPKTKNLRGQAYKIYDQAGLLVFSEYDFKKNSTVTNRQLLSLNSLANIEQPCMWAINTNQFNESQAANKLDSNENYSETMSFDALNRVIQAVAADGSVTTPSYNESNLLARLKVKVKGGSEQSIINDIDYNARRQRQHVNYANNCYCHNDYDDQTFRLAKQIVKKYNVNGFIQNLQYHYDPIGNINSIVDKHNQSLFFNNQQVDPGHDYVYDASYRLIRATGREHQTQLANSPNTSQDYPIEVIRNNDLNALRHYSESFFYDANGNQIKSEKRYNSNLIRREFTIAQTSNRLLQTKASTSSQHLSFETDANGNITKTPNLNQLQWDYKDRLIAVDLQGGGNAYYQYDSSMQRVRKLVLNNSLLKERVYLGGYEIYREYVVNSTDNSLTLKKQRDTLHVNDDRSRLAMIETLMVENGNARSNLISIVRYQVNDHIGSAAIELDNNAEVLGYEEYYAYGSTAYRAQKSTAGISQKRYRYSGKETDEETSFYYYGARYYSAYLHRWLTPDPAGIVDGLNLFQFVRNNPISFVDPEGYSTSENIDINNNICRIDDEDPTSTTSNSGDDEKARQVLFILALLMANEIGNVETLKPGVDQLPDNMSDTTQSPQEEEPIKDKKGQKRHGRGGKEGHARGMTTPPPKDLKPVLIEEQKPTDNKPLPKKPKPPKAPNLPAHRRPNTPRESKGAGRKTFNAKASNILVPGAKVAGAGFTLHGVYKSGDRIAGGLVDDLTIEQSYGQHTVRAVASESAGWAAALAAAPEGAAVGATIGAAGGPVAIIGGIVGGLVAGSMAYWAASNGAELIIDAGVEATGAENYVPEKLRPKPKLQEEKKNYPNQYRKFPY